MKGSLPLRFGLQRRAGVKRVAVALRRARGAGTLQGGSALCLVTRCGRLAGIEFDSPPEHTWQRRHSAQSLHCPLDRPPPAQPTVGFPSGRARPSACTAATTSEQTNNLPIVYTNIMPNARRLPRSARGARGEQMHREGGRVGAPRPPDPTPDSRLGIKMHTLHYGWSTSSLLAAWGAGARSSARARAGSAPGCYVKSAPAATTLRKAISHI